MEEMELEAFYRKELGKGPCRRLRKQGMIPAVFYGAGEETIPLAVRLSDLRKTFSTPERRRSIFTLVIKGLGDGEVRKTAILKEVQRDTLKDQLLHVDFQGVKLEEEIYMEVPIEIVGKPKGVEKGGLLEVFVRSVEVKGIAAKIPPVIKLDVSNLDIGDSIHVMDLNIEGVKITSDPLQTIATVVAPEMEEAPTEGSSGSSS
jgi:large subunit ribosomal protein L25